MQEGAQGEGGVFRVDFLGRGEVWLGGVVLGEVGRGVGSVRLKIHT